MTAGMSPASRAARIASVKCLPGRMEETARYVPSLDDVVGDAAYPRRASRRGTRERSTSREGSTTSGGGGRRMHASPARRPGRRRRRRRKRGRSPQSRRSSPRRRWTRGTAMDRPPGTRLHAPPHRVRVNRASAVAASIHPTGIRRRRRHIASTPRAPGGARSCDALQLSGETPTSRGNSGHCGGARAAGHRRRRRSSGSTAHGVLRQVHLRGREARRAPARPAPALVRRHRRRRHRARQRAGESRPHHRDGRGEARGVPARPGRAGPRIPRRRRRVPADVLGVHELGGVDGPTKTRTSSPGASRMRSSTPRPSTSGS